MSKPAVTYHLRPIPKGHWGSASKLVEEALELMDAIEQGVRILELTELADLWGAWQACWGDRPPPPSDRRPAGLSRGGAALVGATQAAWEAERTQGDRDKALERVYFTLVETLRAHFPAFDLNDLDAMQQVVARALRARPQP